RNAGWRPGVPWGFEVRLPVRDGKPFDLTKEGRRVKHPLSAWTALGVTRVDGSALIGDGLGDATLAGLLAPVGADGPAFLVLRNFDAVYSYNASTSYALSIVHLADRLRGGPVLATAWPTDDLGLSRAERRELQSLLRDRGHEIGAVDGLLTARTRDAVRVEQARLGQDATGRPGQKLLEALRGG
ncbi:MAG: peptidoglycan-binding protein, partial [Gemmatimonadaceae bacterium]